MTKFVGRRREIAGVRRGLGAVRLLTLTGAGGVGKTRLAFEAAQASRNDFPDGVWLVDLAPVQDPSAVAGAAGVAFGIPDHGGGLHSEQLVNHLAGREALIVLDNCEHLADACAELTYAILSAAPGVRVLTTSRHALGIGGEHLYPVLPLPEDEAVELLVDRAIAVHPDFRLTEGNRTAVARLCADLDGLPLAIELAASRLRTLTVQQLTDRLEDRFSLLTRRDRIADPRHRTLRAMIDSSYELCDPAERQLWNRLSVFAGTFALDAAEDVCSGEGIARTEVLELLDRLVAQSVVLACECDGLPGYRLLESIRQYGRERLVETGEEERMLRRHCEFFLALAQRITDRWCGPGQVESLARLRAEHSNLRAALDSCDDPQTVLMLAAALDYYWCSGGFLGEGRHHFNRALATAPDPTPARARALGVAARVALLQGDLPAVEEWTEEAEELAERLDDPMLRARVQDMRGGLAQFRGELGEAMSHYGDAAARYLAIGDDFEAILSLSLLTVLQTLLRDPQAVDSGRQAVALSEARGERFGRGMALADLGYTAWLRGDREASVALATAALEMQQGFDNHIGVMWLLELLAWVSASYGDHEQAGRLLGSVRSLSRRLGIDLSAPPHVAEQHMRCEEAVAAALGRVSYEKALREGGYYDSPGDAITFALGAASDLKRATEATATNSLTRRETEVAALVAKGMSNRQIASELKLSPRTADRHMENILAKFGFRSRAQIAAWWVQDQIPRS
ncbi:LuxR C-terminal-related transcriptional regulator [Streptomyces sp. NPDC057199]|uniref:LuxR C-terminal-related transcriptional regulator n=1 Tax=Streptomyces sp. NPDC057199 TaxID=3346047 RepID=UPI0036409C82